MKQITQQVKTCTKCKETKIVALFSIRGQGFRCHCKECEANNHARYRERKKELERQRHAKYRELQTDAISIYRKNYRRINKKIISVRHCKYLNTQREHLTDVYIKILIKGRFGLSNYTIENNPESIETYRIQLKFKHLLKQKKHGSIKTS